jgi:hypothetical protein
MPIGSVREQSSSIIVYDEKGRTLFTKSRGSRPGDGLQGYTATTVSIRTGSSINTYDDRGRTLFSKPA